MAVDRLPEFPSLPGVGEHLRGAISFSPSVDEMELAYDDAKYGRFSQKPYIDMIIPTLVDPTMAPPGKHVISCFVQYAPYQLAPELGTWDDQREAFGDAVVNRISEFAPGFKDIDPVPERPDAARHRADDRPDRGQHLPGRADPRAAVLQPPGPRLRPVPDAGPRPLAVRLVDPSGRRDHGRERPDRRPRGAPLARPEGRLTMAERHDVDRHRRRPQRPRHRRPISRGPAGACSSSSGADHVGGAAETAELGGVRSRGWRTRSGGSGRRSSGSRPPLARAAARRAGCPRLRPATGRPGGHALDRPGPDRRRPPLVVRPRRRRLSRLRPARPLARRGSSPSSPAQTPPDIKSPGLGDALTGPEARADVPRPRQARRPHDPAGPADGRRGLRGRGVRDRRRSGPRSPGAAFGTRSSGRGRRARPRSCSATAPATTAARPARRCSRSAARARCQRGARGRGPRGRGRDPLRCRGRGDHLPRQPRDRRRAGVRRGDRRARPSSPASTRSGPSSSSPTRSRSARRCAGGPATTGRRASSPRSISSSIACRAFTAAGGDDEQLLRGRILAAPGIDAIERAFDAAKYGRVSDTPVLEATIPSLVDPSLVDGAPDGTHVMSVTAQYAPFTLRDGSGTTPGAGDAFADRVVGVLDDARARASRRAFAPAR